MAHELYDIYNIYISNLSVLIHLSLTITITNKKKKHNKLLKILYINRHFKYFILQCISNCKQKLRSCVYHLPLALILLKIACFVRFFPLFLHHAASQFFFLFWHFFAFLFALWPSQRDLLPCLALPPFLGFFRAHTKAKQVFHLAFGISQRKSRSPIDAEPKPAQKHSSSPVNRTKVALMAESKKYI